LKNKKGFNILLIIIALSVILGIRGIVKLSKQEALPQNIYNNFESFDEDSDDFDDAEDNSSSFNSDLHKIVSIFNKNSNEDDIITKPGSKNYISVIYINGVISQENKTYNQKWLLRQIKKAQKDSKNCGLLLFIDSPGGTVYEADDAYLALQDYKKETKRPIYAYFASLAASGGYYIGCAADKIYANRNTLTGSIGVIAGQSIDATALMEKFGIKMTTITAGRNKNMGGYNAPLTQEQRDIMQSIADEAYAQFTGIVAESRNLNIDAVKELADGRIYTAYQAINHGLIDEICRFEEAKENIRKNFDEEIQFVTRKYQYEENLLSMLSGVSSLIKNPEAKAYQLMGSSVPKCLYLYQ